MYGLMTKSLPGEISSYVTFCVDFSSFGLGCIFVVDVAILFVVDNVKVVSGGNVDGDFFGDDDRW